MSPRQKLAEPYWTRRKLRNNKHRMITMSFCKDGSTLFRRKMDQFQSSVILKRKMERLSTRKRQLLQRSRQTSWEQNRRKKPIPSHCIHLTTRTFAGHKILAQTNMCTHAKLTPLAYWLYPLLRHSLILRISRAENG